MKLTVLSYNTLFAGREKGDARRADVQLRVIRDVQPDIFLMQEAKGLDVDGGALLYALEHQLGMRGFLVVAPRTGQNVAVFIRVPLRAIAFEPDVINFHHALACLTVELPAAKSVHEELLLLSEQYASSDGTPPSIGRSRRLPMSPGRTRCKWRSRRDSNPRPPDS